MMRAKKARPTWQTLLLDLALTCATPLDVLACALLHGVELVDGARRRIAGIPPPALDPPPFAEPGAWSAVRADPRPLPRDFRPIDQETRHALEYRH